MYTLIASFTISYSYNYYSKHSPSGDIINNIYLYRDIILSGIHYFNTEILLISKMNKI